jgi:hypothetical protein
MTDFIIWFSPFSCYFLFLGSKYSPQHLIPRYRKFISFPWNERPGFTPRVLPENLTVTQLVKTCSAFYKIRMFIKPTVFTTEWPWFCPEPHTSSRIWGSHGGEYEDGCLLGRIALMMEAARTFETLVNFYQTTRRYNPEDNHLHTNPVYVLTTYFLKYKYILTLAFHLRLGLLRGLFPSCSSTKIMKATNVLRIQ